MTSEKRFVLNLSEEERAVVCELMDELDNCNMVLDERTYKEIFVDIARGNEKSANGKMEINYYDEEVCY